MPLLFLWFCQIFVFDATQAAAIVVDFGEDTSVFLQEQLNLVATNPRVPETDEEEADVQREREKARDVGVKELTHEKVEGARELESEEIARVAKAINFNKVFQAKALNGEDVEFEHDLATFEEEQANAVLEEEEHRTPRRIAVSHHQRALGSAILAGEADARRESEKRRFQDAQQREHLLRTQDLKEPHRRTLADWKKERNLHEASERQAEAEEEARWQQAEAALIAARRASDQEIVQKKKLLALNKMKSERSSESQLQKAGEKLRDDAMQRSDVIEDSLDGLYDVSMSHLLAFIGAADKVAKSEDFVAAVLAAVADTSTSAEAYEKHSRLLIKTLDREAPTVSQEDLIPLLATLFADELRSLTNHGEEVRSSWNHTRSQLPSEVLISFAQVASSLPNLASPIMLDKFKFAATPVADVCQSQILPFFEQLQAYNANLTKAQFALNATSRLLPKLGEMMPDVDPHLEMLLSRSVAMGYGELIVLKAAVTDLMKHVTPITNDRLHCSSSSNSFRASSNMMALMLLLLVSLRLH